MTAINEKDYLISSTEYGRSFWNAMRTGRYAQDSLQDGVDAATGGFALPTVSGEKLAEAIQRESVLRSFATVVKAYGGSSRIFARDCSDLAAWVPENGSIPVYDGIGDFTRYPVDSHKLAVFVKLDEDFVHDASFDIESYLTDRLGKNFAKAEDAAFINGTGTDMPTGILSDTAGAEIGVTTSAITFDDMLRLYFSLDKEYRRNAVWLMNDEAALSLRLLKDSAGYPLWNHTNDTILGKPVIICNDMPSVQEGAKPVVFGDFRYYWIVERGPVSVQTLKEKFIMQGQLGYLAAEFLDAKLIRREAVRALMMNGTEQNG